MIDYSYVECSMASLSAVYMFHQHYPEHRVDEVRRSAALPLHCRHPSEVPCRYLAVTLPSYPA